jgi:hypothetical protein
MEKWSPIPDTHYSVSSKGRVRNDETSKIKALDKKRDGYCKVDLYSDGIRSSERVHRLVAEAFVPNPDNKPQVNHIDGNKLNNNVENLEWVDNSENMIHAYKTGLESPHPTYGMRGHRNPNGGRKGVPIFCVETGQTFNSAAEAERITGIPDSCIFDCLKGNCRHAHHLHFQYV